MVWFLVIGLFSGPIFIPVPYQTEAASWEAFESSSFRNGYWDQDGTLDDVGAPLGFACVPAPKQH